MNLKLDENVDARLAARLRDAGHDALTVREQDLHGTDDIDLYQLCISENRILVTLDLDFSIWLEGILIETGFHRYDDSGGPEF